MHQGRRNGLSALVIAASIGLVATACTSGNGPSAPDPADVELTYRSADGSCAAEPAAGVDLAGAEALVESFQDVPTDPVRAAPLPAAPEPGTVVAFLNNDTVVTGIMQQHLEAASAVAGVEFVNISAGTDAQSINTAANTAVELAPDILISVAIDATFFQDQLEQLEANGTSIVYGSATNATDFGLDDSLGGRAISELNGELLGAAAISFTCGTGDDFVFYNTPEMSFSTILQEAAAGYLAEACPECTLRVVDISIVDPSPADKIVSDLQSNPATDFFLSAVDQFQIGLADKAALAGITNAHGIGQSSLPPNIEQIVAGQQDAGFAVDLDMLMWLLMDEGLRKDQGVWDGYGDWLAPAQAISRILTPQNAQEFLGGFVASDTKETVFAELWGR